VIVEASPTNMGYGTLILDLTMYGRITTTAAEKITEHKLLFFNNTKKRLLEVFRFKYFQMT